MSDVARIADQAAAIAAFRLGEKLGKGVIAPSGNGLVGIRQIFAAGTGLVGDPLRVGQTVAAQPSNVTAPYTFIVGTPTSNGGPRDQQTFLYTRQYPLRLYLDTNLLDAMFSLATRFMAALDEIYLHDLQMAGLCDRCWISSIGPIAKEDDWAALVATLTVEEGIRLP